MLNVPAYRLWKGDATIHGVVQDVVENDNNTITLITDKYPAGYTVNTVSRVPTYTEAD